MKEEYKHSLPAKFLSGLVGVAPGISIGFIGSAMVTKSNTVQSFSKIAGAVLGSVICASRGNELYNDITNHIDNPYVESIDSDGNHQPEYKNSLSAKIIGGSLGLSFGISTANLVTDFTKDLTVIGYSLIGVAILGTTTGAYLGNQLYNDIIDHIDQSHEIALVGVDNYSI